MPIRLESAVAPPRPVPHLPVSDRKAGYGSMQDGRRLECTEKWFDFLPSWSGERSDLCFSQRCNCLFAINTFFFTSYNVEGPVTVEVESNYSRNARDSVM
jgi:hypothetical protein